MLDKFNNIPTELKNCSQWVLWRKEKRNGKLTKVPYQVNSKMAQANNRNTWSSFEMVVEKYKQGGYDGIGFVLVNKMITWELIWINAV